MSKKIKDMEILRGLAVWMVIFAHIPYFGKFVKPLFLQSWTGVDLFFVISGCVVSRSLLLALPEATGNLFERIQAYKSTLQNFFVKRIFRILPLSILWAVIPLSCAFIFNSSHTFQTKTLFEAFNQLIAILTLQYNYLYIFDLIPHELGYYWSLAVEEHFYLLLPLFFLLVPSNENRVKWSLAFIGVTSFIIRPLFPLEHVDSLVSWNWMRFASHNRFDSLFLGVVIGLLLHGSRAQKTKAGIGPLVLMVFFVTMLWLVPAMSATSGVYGFQITIINFICFVLVLFASQDRDILGSIRGFRGPGLFFGARSYALYLIHYPAYRLTEEIFFRAGQESVVGKTLFFICLTFALVELSYRLIELPFISFGKKLLIKQA